MVSNHNYIAIEGHATSNEEAIRLCAAALYEAGYVEEGFSEDCIEREKEYPTGLCCTCIPVAIPHCQSKTIKKDGICYLRLKEPVVFGRMDDDEEVVKTKSIFNIAIKNADDHLDFLKQMMSIITDEELVQRLESVDIEEVPEVLEYSFKQKRQ